MATTSCGRSRRHALLLATTVLVSGFAAPALAQSQPAYRNFDANGVDLVRGDYLLTFEEGSIGSGPGKLSLMRRAGSAAGGPSQWDGITLTKTEPYPGGTETITNTRGNIAERFTGSGGSYSSSLAVGSTLTGGGSNLVYRMRDGVEITFSDPTGNPQSGATNFCKGYLQTSCALVPTQIATPDGKTVTLDWTTNERCSDTYNPDGSLDCEYDWRLRGVANAASYSIVFAYTTDIASGVPSAAWYQRTGAAFSNTVIGGTHASVSYAYPSSGVTDVTDTGGRVWRVSPGTLRRPTASSDTTVVTTGSSGTVTGVTKNGVSTTYARSVLGSTGTMVVTDAQSNITTIVSNLTIGRPTSITDALSHTTGFTYDTAGRLTRVTRHDGNYVEYTLDGRGNATQTDVVPKTGSGLSTITTTAAYDATCTTPSCNSPNSTIDALGNITNYDYDPTTGLVTKIKAPAATSGANRPETRFSYTAVSGVTLLSATSTCQTGAAPSCVGTADEVKTTITYNSNLLPTSMSTGAGDGSLTATTGYTYDVIGNQTYVDGPLSGTADTTRTLYNAARQVVGVISPDPDGGGSLPNRAQRMTYNNDGQVTKVERGSTAGQSDSAWSSFTPAESLNTSYDANARKSQDVVADGVTPYAVTQYSYDSLGRPDCTAVRMNPSAFGSLPGACTASTTGSYGADRISKVTYNAASQVTKVQSAYGQTEQADDATVTYNNNSTTATATDGEGHVTTYEYDGFDRLVKTRFPVASGGTTSSTTDYEGLTYDANGNVTQRRVRDGQTISYTYDNLNRMTAKDRPNGTWWDTDYTYAYDLLGRMTTAAHVGSGLPVYSFGYDALGRKTSESSTWYGNGNLTYAYDLAGRRTRTTWADGLYVDYDHLVTGEVSAIRENGATSGVGVLGSYAYDNLGRMTTLTRGNGVVTSYGYDAVSRLSSLAHDLASTANDVSTTFTYNPASQIASSTRDNDTYAWNGHSNRDLTETPNGLNQLVSQGSTWFTYDSLGNLYSGDGRYYGYSSENELKTWNLSGLAYNPFGLIFNEYIASGTNTTFQYDGAQITTESNASTGGLVRRYVYGPGTDDPLVWYEGTGTSDRRWLIPDERGSVTAVTDASGAATTINRYDEYGVPASGNAGRFGYTGQTWLSDLGMWNYKARIYNPAIGRFIQSDPIGYGAGMNLYGYVSGDPLNLVDPSGMIDLPKPTEPPESSPENVTGDDIIVTGSKRKCTILCSSSPVYIPPIILNLGLAPGLAATSNGNTTASGDGTNTTICPAVPSSRPVGNIGTVGAALRDPEGAYAARLIADQALKEAARAYPNLPGIADARDAFRHFYWVSGMTRVMGADRALAFANGHEADSIITSSQQLRDQQMDTFNNSVSAQMTTNPRFNKIPTAELAKMALNNRCLDVIRK